VRSPGSIAALRRIGPGLLLERRSQGGSKVVPRWPNHLAGCWSSGQRTTGWGGCRVMWFETTYVASASRRIESGLLLECRSQGGSKVAL
jgi:hypothetical protein